MGQGHREGEAANEVCPVNQVTTIGNWNSIPSRTSETSGEHILLLEQGNICTTSHQ